MAKALKILHLSESFGWSGGAAQALALAKGLEQRGHTNIMACPEGGDLWLKSRNAGLEVRQFRPKRDYDIPCAVKLAGLFDLLKPDLVNAHHPKAHAMGLIAKMLSRHKPVFVVTRRVSHPLITTLFAKLKYKSRLVNGYITVAEAIRKLFLDYGLPPHKVRTIYSGTDPERFKPGTPSQKIISELSLPTGLPVIGLVGNFSRDKGQHLLVRAAARLASENRKFVLIFAGRDTDSQGLRDLLTAAGFPPENARLLGLRQDVPELLTVMSVHLNCAIKGEALSGSIREAMAAGVPVIASDISGNGEIVKHDETGLLFSSGSEAELYTRLKYSLENPSVMAEFAGKGLLDVRTQFTVDVMVERTLCYYKELLSVN